MSSVLDFSGVKRRGLAIGLVMALALLPEGRTATTVRSSTTSNLCKLELGEIRDRFDLADDRDLARLHAATSAWAALVKGQQRTRSQRREDLLAGAPVQVLPSAALDEFFSEPAGHLDKRDQRGLEQLRRLSALALVEKDPALKRRQINLLVETAEALNHNHRPPIPTRIDLVELPFVHYEYTHHRVATGETPAWNVDGRPDRKVDPSRLDPQPSTFWSRPADISALNLFEAFGRNERLRIADELLIYHEPKISFGGHAGFVAKRGSLEIKVKFGEQHSEPFAARLFWALGYNVDTTDYVPNVRLKYDRRLFREFNQRREVSTRISAFAVLPVYTIRFQPRHDPFQFIAEAVMKDGARVSGLKLKAELLRDSARWDAEDDPGNFRPEVEQAIDYLVTTSANVQFKDGSAKSIGPWSFGGLGHEGRRELRGAGLLAAWIGWSDSRFDNTRLKVVETANGPELKHYFTDLGGGLGRSTGLIYRQGELPNEFAWTFTLPARFQGKGRMTIPFRITGYQPIDDTPAFEQMTIDDARWMARLIGRLTENQIVSALIASGFGSAHVRLYTEKLISRRDGMIRDLGLADELPLLRPAGVSRRLSYNPGTDGPVHATLPDGRQAIARDEPCVIMDGRLRLAPFKER